LSNILNDNYYKNELKLRDNTTREVHLPVGSAIKFRASITNNVNGSNGASRLGDDDFWNVPFNYYYDYN
jgi:hypothetical protein